MIAAKRPGLKGEIRGGRGYNPLMLVRYEEIVSEYEEGLRTQLRGFRPAHEFLETWVHDEDPVRSILNMVEAAELGGLKALDIAIGPETASRIDRKRLIEMAEATGKMALKKGDADGFVLQVTLSEPDGRERLARTPPKAGKGAPKKQTAMPDSVSPEDPQRYYLWAQGRCPRDPSFEKAWPEGETGVQIQASFAKFFLRALVDPKSHRILRMFHNAHEVWRDKDGAVLNGLCKVSQGSTVQDVSEHAVIRLENFLRGSNPRLVSGVIQPENSVEQAWKTAPVMSTLAGLVRALRDDYQKKNPDFTIGMNTDEGPAFQASSEWGTSTVSERMQKILAALPVACPETDIRGADVKVKSLAGPRVTVELPTSTPQAAQQRYLTLLELQLRAKVDPRLEVFLDDKKDANTKRHATEEALGI